MHSQTPTPTSTLHKRAILDELAEMAMELTRSIVDVAESQPEPDPALIRLFIQLASTIRQTFALEARLAAPPPQPVPAPAKPDLTKPDPERKARLVQLVHAAAKFDPNAPPASKIDQYFEDEFDSQHGHEPMPDSVALAIVAFKVCGEIGITPLVENNPDEQAQPKPG